MGEVGVGVFKLLPRLYVYFMSNQTYNCSELLTCLQTTFLKNVLLGNSKTFWVKNLPINWFFKSSCQKNCYWIWPFCVNRTVMYITLSSIFYLHFEPELSTAKNKSNITSRPMGSLLELDLSYKTVTEHVKSTLIMSQCGMHPVYM